MPAKHSTFSLAQDVIGALRLIALLLICNSHRLSLFLQHLHHRGQPKAGILCLADELPYALRELLL